MAADGDLIDFEVIETSKENIQSLPGGRSAKQLSLLLSPSQNHSANNTESLNQSAELKNTIRADFEKELESIEEADDPLEVFDRYVKWTTNAYPTAQATPESGLLPLVERATKSLLGNSTYKNDPRYLKIWLLYIKLFSDSPRETYAFLARHEIGDGLALYYEEFAAWLEAQGCWTQAEEVYCAGVDKEARPKERLLRKYAEFQHRREVKTSDDNGPNSPALPQMRPALAPRTDPFAVEEADPQAGAAPVPARTAKSGRAKMAIFSDDEAPPAQSGAPLAPSGPSWDSIGSLADRKKENTREASSWVGEKLDGGKKIAGPKLSVFKDPVSLSWP
jgi:checkpoint serine/threonine-protein kinase